MQPQQTQPRTPLQMLLEATKDLLSRSQASGLPLTLSLLLVPLHVLLLVLLQVTLWCGVWGHCGHSRCSQQRLHLHMTLQVIPHMGLAQLLHVTSDSPVRCCR